MESRWTKSLLCFSGHNNIETSAGFLTSLSVAITGRSRARPGKKGSVSRGRPVLPWAAPTCYEDGDVSSGTRRQMEMQAR